MQEKIRSAALIAVDVGNTATVVGLFLPQRSKIPKPTKTWIVSTPKLKIPLKRVTFLKKVFRESSGPRRDREVLISSVVPSLHLPLRRSFKRVFGSYPHFVTHQTSSKVKVRVNTPSEAGADRIVNARAAVSLHPGPSVVIDFGTATTFDCISSQKEYLGGVIAPGPLISAEALFERTARLPLVELRQPVPVLGRDTLHSIRSGLYHGYRGLVVHVVSLLKKRLGAPLKVFSTGGQARWILKGLPLKTTFVPHLTLLGLFHLWQDGKTKKKA